MSIDFSAPEQCIASARKLFENPGPLVGECAEQVEIRLLKGFLTLQKLAEQKREWEPVLHWFSSHATQYHSARHAAVLDRFVKELKRPITSIEEVPRIDVPVTVQMLSKSALSAIVSLYAKTIGHIDNGQIVTSSDVNEVERLLFGSGDLQIFNDWSVINSIRENYRTWTVQSEGGHFAPSVISVFRWNPVVQMPELESFFDTHGLEEFTEAGYHTYIEGDLPGQAGRIIEGLLEDTYEFGGCVILDGITEEQELFASIMHRMLERDVRNRDTPFDADRHPRLIVLRGDMRARGEPS